MLFISVKSVLEASSDIKSHSEECDSMKWDAFETEREGNKNWHSHI